MACLSSGVLLKLVNEMKGDEKSPKSSRPKLLQIRSIIPISAEGDLWPTKGFYLKVSDSSHTMYVSLPHEHDDMVLCNKLQLGQLIYVEKFEPSHPIPMLRGIKLVPTIRHRCVRNAEDLVALDHLANFDGAFCLELKVKKDVIVEKKPCEKLRILNVKTRKKLVENYDEDKDKDGDYASTTTSSSSLSSLSSLYARTTKRRSWNGVEMKQALNLKQISRSACTSPVRSTRYDGSDNNSSQKPKGNDILKALKSVKTSTKNRTHLTMKSYDKGFDPTVTFQYANEKILTESNNIEWNYLPSNLVKYGKEMLRQRDVALLASVEALQEASAAERLLKCLSLYSQLQSTKEEEQQPSVNVFFNLQENLNHTNSIVQSLTKISPLKDNENDQNTPSTIREAIQLAMDRKRNGTLWIKSALAYDLAPPYSSNNVSKETTNVTKSLSPSNSIRKLPKSTCLVKKQRNNSDIQIGLVIEKENSQDWVKGSALVAANELTNCLHDESRRWFLAHVESYFDDIVNNKSSISMESDSQVAEVMYQIKKVNDWLDMIVEVNSPKSGSKNGSTLEDSQLEACKRVRNKIYSVLLKNVEKTARVWENMNTMLDLRVE